MFWAVPHGVARLHVARTAYVKRVLSQNVSRVPCGNRCISATLLLHLVCVRRDDRFGTLRGDEGARHVFAPYMFCLLIEWPMIVRVLCDLLAHVVCVSSMPLKCNSDVVAINSHVSKARRGSEQGATNIPPLTNCIMA